MLAETDYHRESGEPGNRSGTALLLIVSRVVSSPCVPRLFPKTVACGCRQAAARVQEGS